MELVDGPELCKRLKAAVKSSKRAKMAVAFWGDGAIKNLGLDNAKDIEVICNLRMGGTNPQVIEDLIAAGATVLHSDVLHAKIYLTGGLGAVGSSNASGNGLSFQDAECSGWNEANILFGSGPLYDDAERMYARIRRAAVGVEDADLDRARKAWSARRRIRPRSVRSGQSLFYALRTNPESLADRGIYLCVYGSSRSKEADEALEGERAQTGLGKDLDAFEDWDALPDDADLVTFYLGPRGRFYFDGYWHMPKHRREAKLSDSTLLFCDKLTDVQGYTDVGSIEDWKALVLRVKESGEWDHEDGSVLMEMGGLARRFIKKDAPKRRRAAAE